MSVRPGTEVRIAVVGYGLIGARHAQVIELLPDVSLAAIVEPSEPQARAARTRGLPVFDSLERMCDAIAVDGVVLATPTPLHLEQGLACVARGLPALIEKPITATVSEARQLTAAAEAAGVPLLVGHHRRHNGIVRAAREALDQGAIGTIRSVQVTCWFYKPDAYFAAAPWRTRKGAGPISVNLVHDVDLMRHFCGEVATVQAQAAPALRGYENEDLAAALLAFRSGALGTLQVSDAIAAPWSWELTSAENPAYPATGESAYLIGGSAGSLSLPDLRLWHHEGGADWMTPISARTLLRDQADPLAVQAAHFARVIRGEDTPLVSGQEGLRSLEVVEAVATAARTGQTVAIGAG